MEQVVERIVERIGTSYFGKYRGIVTDVSDPENRCRIRARLDGLLDGKQTKWAMPAVPFAGNRLGMVMLPKVGSGVWIEFEAGSLDIPIWSGAWWGSGQRPDPQGEQVRVIVSESGHQVVLDDAGGEVKVVHGNGPEIKMTATEVVITVGACELKITNTEISLNNGLIKVGLAGVSLVNGAMAFGVPP